MSRHKSKKDKVFERIPPMIGFSILIFIIVTSIFAPTLAAVAILSVNAYFLYKSIAYFGQFALGLAKIRNAEQIDWMEKLEGLENIPQEIENLKSQINRIKCLKYSEYKKDEYNQSKNFFLFVWEKRKTISFLKSEVKNLISLKEKDLMSFRELKHIIIVPYVNEPIDLIRETLDYLKNQTFPTKQISVVLASEAAFPEGKEFAKKLKKEYEEYFGNIWITQHVLQPEDAVGKSANMAWAGRKTYDIVMKKGWDLKKTTLTSCDSDSKIDPRYYAYMSYMYLITEEPEYKYYTAAMVFYNNIWRLKFYARVKNSMSSIHNVGKMVRADKLVPVSTYTTSFWMIKQIDFWTPWVTPEDYHMFFKALFKYDHKVETIPIYLKTLSDAAEGKTHWETIVNNYKQSRRWSWGISDDGWVLKNLLKDWNKYSIRSKYIAFHVLFDHITGPVIAILILVGGNIPPWLNDSFHKVNLGANLPYISSNVIRITMIFMVLVILLDLYLKPRPKKHPTLQLIISIFEWPFLTLTGIFLTIIPGLEAHTRLIFGRYLEYYVTVKKSDKKNI